MTLADTRSSGPYAPPDRAASAFAAPDSAAWLTAAGAAPQTPLTPLSRYLHEVLADSAFCSWRDLYLPLRARRIIESARPADDVLWSDSPRGLGAENYPLFQEPAEDALVILRQESHVALLGEAGAGKTTVLHRFMLDLAEQALVDLAHPDAPLEVPVYTQLNLLDRQRTVEALIWDTLRHYGLPTANDPDPSLLALLPGDVARPRPARFVFLLDGLNEAPADAAARRALRAFLRRFNDHKFILACRTRDYTPIRGYQAAELLQLTRDDVAIFLHRYLPADKAEALMQELATDAPLHELALNPLALYMFIQIARTGQEVLPKNRGVLFQRFTDHLLERPDTEWHRDSDGARASSPLPVRQHALAELGWHMQEAGVQSLPQPASLTILRQAITPLLPPAHRSAARDVLDECISSSLLRRSPDQTRVEFLHQAVQEYFAAQGLRLRSADIAPYLAGPDQRHRWANVIALYFSLAPDRPPILRAILRDSGDYGNIWLAAECLMGVGLDSEVLDQVRRALDATETGPYLFAQGLAYRRLGRLPEALTRLHEALKLLPESAYVRYELGYLYRQIDQYRCAIQILEEALTLDPFFVDAYNQLGLTYYGQGQYVEALTVFQTTVQLEPDNAFHYYNLGRVHKMLRLYPAALEDFQRAVELKPDYTEAQEQLHLLQQALSTQALNLLERIPLLNKLTLEQFILLSRQLQAQEYAPGQVIFRRGDIGEAFYIVESGQVSVLAPGPGGEEREINTLSAGDFFGEIALLRAVPRTATVISRSPTRLLALNRADFDAITRYPTVASGLEETSSRRLGQDRQRASSGSGAAPRDTRYLAALAQQVEVTALVADIHGSTGLMQVLGPHQMVDFLDQFLLAMTNAIVEHNGAVGRSLGDSVLGVFGAGSSSEEVAPRYGVRAVLAALAMRRAFLSLKERWQQVHPQCQAALAASGLGIGLCTGKVALGTVGMEQNLVGAPVNLAAHLSKLVRQDRAECDVYMDQRTYSITSNAFRVESITLAAHPDFTEPTLIYRVLENR